MQLYKISFLNGCSSKSYIGISSKSAKQRFIEHCSSKKKYPIVQAIKKYGKENTLLTIIGEFKDWNSLYIAEQLAIIEHNTKIPYGYNLTDGGKGCFGLPASEDRKRKIGEANKGRKISEEQKKIISENNKNRDMSDQVLAMQKSNIGRKRPAHIAELMLKIHTGRKASAETKQKQSDAKIGKPSGFCGRKHSVATKLKIANSQRLRLSQV